jgi:hypothetical protein
MNYLIVKGINNSYVYLKYKEKASLFFLIL